MTMLGNGEVIMGDSAADKPPVEAADKVPAKPPALDDDKAPAAADGDRMLNDLIGLKKKEITISDLNTRQMEDRVSRDRARMDEAFRREQFAAGSMPPPWDADKERDSRMRGPYEEFGSIATVFAMFASLATRTPLTSALNAGASAMNAMHQSDEKAYDQAYQAYKDNAERALKQFNVERQVFDDTQRLMSSDITAWRATQIANEARFGNRKALYLLENGMDKEYLEARTSQITAAEKMKEAVVKGDLFDTQHRMFSEAVKEFDKEHPDAKPAEKMQFRLNTLRNIMGGEKSTEMQIYTDQVNQYWRANGHEPPAEWKTEKLKEVMGARYGARSNLSPAARIALRAAEYQKPEAEGGRGMNPIEAMTQAEKDEKAASASPAQGNLTLDRQIAASAATHKEELKKEHPDWTNEKLDSEAMKYASKLKTTAAAPSGNRIDDLKGKLHQVAMAKELTTNIDRMLQKHGAISGVGGTLTRTAEVISNILGSSATDRKQFQRWVLEMQEIAPRILLDTKGRPLGSEAGRINGIIAGLSPGDTGPNTIRAYIEFRKVLDDTQKDLERRIGGASQEQAPPAAKSGEDWWKSPAAGPVVH